MNKVIFLVDMQSFYASVEKADNPNIQHKPVIVSGDPKRRSGIILAACPLAKRSGVETAEPLWKALAKCPEAVIVRPRMQRYIEVSYEITKVLERFSDLVEVFSIDEQFIDVTGTRHLFGEPTAIALELQKAIMEQTGVHSRVGIGPNKVLAKIACDAFAKKMDKGIFWLHHGNFQDVMWPLPIGKMFGVGKRMEHHLKWMGIHTIGQLANFPIELLKKRWGINGEVLWKTANGIDYSNVTPNTHSEQKAIGHQMTLPRDYETLEEIKVVLLELSEEVAKRARAHNYWGSTVAVGARGADFENPTGFYRQVTLSSPTNFGVDIFQAAFQLFATFWKEYPVRSVSVALSQLQPVDCYQLSFFDFSIRKEKLSEAMDAIREKYGQTAIIRASSLTKAGQAFIRAKKIGGHYK